MSPNVDISVRVVLRGSILTQSFSDCAVLSYTAVEDLPVCQVGTEARVGGIGPASSGLGS